MYYNTYYYSNNINIIISVYSKQMVMEYLKFVAIELIRFQLYKASQENLGGIEVGPLLWDLSIFQSPEMRQCPYHPRHFDVSKN